MKAITDKTKDSINGVESLTTDLQDNNIECLAGGNWLKNGEDISFNDLVNFIFSYRETLSLKRYPKDYISTIFANMEYQIKSEQLKQLKERIKHNPLAMDTFDQLTEILAKDTNHKMNAIVLKHVVWTVKRRIFGLPDYNPIFVNIYGKAGAGKSQFLKHFFSVIPACYKDEVQSASELFNDERHAYRFVNNYVLIMNELTGLNRTDKEKLKNKIDCSRVIFRELGKNKSKEGDNRAQLIGTSNTKLSNTLITDSNLRKWAEIDIYKYPQNEVSDKMVQPLIDFDWLNLWRSVNENDKSPFHNNDIYNDFVIWTQGKCVTQTPTVEFIKEYIVNNSGEFICFGELYSTYSQTVYENSMSKSNLKELLTKYGFKEHRRNVARGFIVPSASQCEYMTGESATEQFLNN